MLRVLRRQVEFLLFLAAGVFLPARPEDADAQRVVDELETEYSEMGLDPKLAD